MKSIKPNKPKAMIVFYKILFPVREKRSAAVSLFPFRQISEFPTGAALLKFRVGIAVWCTLHTVKCLQERSYMTCRQEAGWYRGIDMIVPLHVLCEGIFLCHVASDRARRPNVPENILYAQIRVHKLKQYQDKKQQK